MDLADVTYVAISHTHGDHVGNVALFPGSTILMQGAVSREQTLASLDRIASVLQERKAQLWIGHDKAQSAGLRYAPAYYE